MNVTLLLLPYLFHSSADCLNECSVAFLLCRSVLPTLLHKHANGDRLVTADRDLYKSPFLGERQFSISAGLATNVSRGQFC